MTCGSPHRLAVGQHAQAKHVRARRYEQVVVRDAHAVLRNRDFHVRIQLLDFLRLRRGGAVGEQQAVAGEFVVAWTVAEIAAVAHARRAVGQFGFDCLVDEIPDEAALVHRIAFQRRVFVHVAARIAHRVHVFAGDVRLLRAVRMHRAAVLQVAFDFVGMRIHAAFDIRHVLEFAHVHGSLVMHRTIRVDRVRVAVHRTEHLARARFVAERPDQHARMVVVTPHHAVDAVHARALPFGVAAGDAVFGAFDVVGHPGAVRLHVGFVDQIQAVFVAQVVPIFLVWIVRGADGVDVVPLAEDHVGKHVLAGDRTAALRVEFVAIRAFEHDAFAVERHDAVFDAERTEADVLRHGFDGCAVMSDDAHGQRIQRRRFGAPRRDVGQFAGIERDFAVAGLR